MGVQVLFDCGGNSDFMSMQTAKRRNFPSTNELDLDMS